MVPTQPRFPELGGPDDWPRVHALPFDAWRGALAWAEATFDLRSDSWERLPGGEDSAVFARGPAVVKLVPPCYAADAEREAHVLSRLHLPVPTPRLRGVERSEGWSALCVDRLPGSPAHLAWAALAPQAKAAVLREIGGLLAALRATPLRPADGDALALMERLRKRALRHEEAGFPDVQGFLDRHLPANPPVAFVHFDLNDGNLMLGADGHITGVLDFVASRAFYPVFDLVTPGVFFGRGDPALLEALLDAAGLGALAPEELAAWHLLHPFSELQRDLRMGGRSPEGGLDQAVIGLWRWSSGRKDP